MKSIHAIPAICTICTAAVLTTVALVNAALAQTGFQLPRECLERQVANPERCVIQDGPPRLPLARQAPAGSVPTPATPATSPTSAPSSALAPRSSAPFAVRR